MDKITWNHFTIYYHPSMNVYTNQKTNQVVFTDKLNEEIHALLAFDGKRVNIQPRYNVHFSVEDTEIRIGVNHEE